MNRLREWLQRLLLPPAPPASPVPSAQPESVANDRRTLDLRDEQRILFALLNDFGAWRERLVEEIVIEDGDHVTTSSSYQIRLQAETLAPFAPSVTNGDSVRMLVPLTTRPKDLLLGVDIVGPEGASCFLLLKGQISWLQREYVYDLLGEPPRTAGAEAIIYGISNYSPDVWVEFAERKLSGTALTAAYLDEGLPFPISETDVERWQAVIGPTEQRMARALGEPGDANSAAEHLLRALPFADRLAQSVAEVDSWLADFVALLDGADETALAVIAEYGRRWEVVVETVVPVGQPCKLKLTTRRPWGSDAANRTTQRVAIGEASSTHVELRVADHSIEFDGRPEVASIHGEQLGVPLVDSMRLTADTAAIYVSSSEETPYFVDVSVKLRPRLPIRVLLWSIWAMVAVAIGVALVLPETDQLADNLALLTFPLTLAGAIVLSRDSSAISHRIQQRSRIGLAAAVALLWVVAAIRLLAVDVDIKWLEQTAESVRDVLEHLRFW